MGKSTEKATRSLLVVLAFLLVGLVVAIAQETGDPVVDFYVQRANHAFESRSPEAGGVTYSFRARSHFKHIGRKGRVDKVDSAVVDYYYSWGSLGSQKTVSGDLSQFKNLDLTYPNVFAQDYVYNLFPNDTGGPDLAIGFDTDSSDDARPVGLAVIDRDEYYAKWLYLSYPKKPGHRRYSRSFRFTEKAGRIFPDSVWIVGSSDGVFFSENYRIETSITDITISP